MSHMSLMSHNMVKVTDFVNLVEVCQFLDGDCKHY